MNKSELVDYVSEKTGAYKKDVKHTVDAVFDGIIQGLVEDDKVTISGFGNFIVKQRAPRKGRNPKTGQSVHIRAKSVPTFKPSDILKDAVD